MSIARIQEKEKKAFKKQTNKLKKKNKENERKGTQLLRAEG